MVSDETIEKAVEVVWECGPWTDQESLRIARALAEAGLLAPAPLTEEWGTQYEDGSGPVWRETWDGKRIRTRADAEAVAAQHRIPRQRAMHRHVSDWEQVEP